MSSNKVTHWKTNWYGSSERKKHLFHSRLFTPWPQSEKKTENRIESKKVQTRLLLSVQEVKEVEEEEEDFLRSLLPMTSREEAWTHSFTGDRSTDRPVKGKKRTGDWKRLSLSLSLCFLSKERERNIGSDRFFPRPRFVFPLEFFARQWKRERERAVSARVVDCGGGTLTDWLSITPESERKWS